MTGDGSLDGLAGAGRMDAPTSAAPRLAAGVAQGPAPVSSPQREKAEEPNPVRENMELTLKTLESLRQPTVEQIERKLFLKEYLALKF